MELNEVIVDIIEELNWEDIDKEFNITEKEVLSCLKKGKRHADNFWVPYEEDSYDEDRVEKVKELFISKFPAIEIQSQDDDKYMEIYLDTPDAHRWMYSIKRFFKKKFKLPFEKVLDEIEKKRESEEEQ